ncbi:MAG: type II secretion system F family protein [Candidatus Omnitrophica bacterium]|nr:type II secretion system F family protein [Candidatus Omnitrophota bacterium]
MKQFVYTAKDMAGKVLTGAVEAADRHAAIRMVSEKECFVISIKEVNRQKDLFQKSVTVDTVLAFTRKLKVMLESGIDLLMVLKILWSQTEDKAMQLVVSEIRVLLSKGVPLANALKRFPTVFSDTYISLVAVGERGGVLAFALDKIMDHLIRQKGITQKLKKALTYPTIVFGLAVLVVAGMFLFFIPMFEGIFKKMNVDMPFLTQVLIDISHFFIKTWWILLGIYIMIHIGFKKFRKSRKGRYLTDKYALRIPVIGQLIFYVSLSRFLHTFSVLLESGVSLMDTLHDSTHSTGNQFLSEKLASIEAYLSKGARLSDAIGKIKIMPDFALSLITIGEETGSLANALKVTATMVDEDVDYQINKLTTLIGPISIILIGIFVGVVLVAIYLPIFSLWGGLEK